MEETAHKFLKLYEAIEKDDSQSQRELATVLNCSLGLVNAMIQETIQKGYLKALSPTKNKINYRMTPKGNSHKSKLTLQHLEHSLSRYKHVRLKISKWVEKLVDANIKKVVIFGANDLAEIVYITFQNYNLDVVAIIDDERAGQVLAGWTIQKTSFLQNTSFDALVISLMEFPSDMIDQFVNNGIPKIKIHGIRTAFDNKSVR